MDGLHCINIPIEAGAEKKALDDYGRTPFYVGAGSGCFREINMLLREIVLKENLQDLDEQMALKWALQSSPF